MLLLRTPHMLLRGSCRLLMVQSARYSIPLEKCLSQRPIFEKTVSYLNFFGSFFSVDLGILFRTFTHPIRIQRAASDRTLSYFLQLPAAAVDALGSYRFYWCQLCHASASLLYISCVTCISIPVS